MVGICLCAGFSEKLLHQLEGTNERFEVKLMMMDLISRLIGVHQVSQVFFAALLCTGTQVCKECVIKKLFFVCDQLAKIAPCHRILI